MIFNGELRRAVESLGIQIAEMQNRLYELEDDNKALLHEINKLKKSQNCVGYPKECEKKEPKRGRGRPRKNK